MLGRAGLGRGLVALCCLAAAGCAEFTPGPPEDPTTTAAPSAAATTPSAAEDGTRPEPAAPSPQAAALPDDGRISIGEPPVAPRPQAPPPSVATAALPPEPSAPPLAAPAAPAAPGSGAAPAPSASARASRTSAETLDITSLALRLRKTRAINLLTKVAVKNESDDLLEKFREYHTQHGTATLTELRRAYDSLFGKLHALLQNTDPPLDRDIDRSRAAIWEILTDPRKFSASHLMAGA